MEYLQKTGRIIRTGSMRFMMRCIKSIIIKLWLYDKKKSIYNFYTLFILCK